jgi:hypothetical protein
VQTSLANIAVDENRKRTPIVQIILKGHRDEAIEVDQREDSQPKW